MDKSDGLYARDNTGFAKLIEKGVWRAIGRQQRRSGRAMGVMRTEKMFTYLAIELSQNFKKLLIGK